MKTAMLATVFALLLTAGTMISAHPGGLDSKGCHTNRKTDEYHCHRAQTQPSDAQDIVSQSGNASAGGPVKLSKSGICHDKNSPWYEQTKNYTPFKSLRDCLQAGGRLPKGT